MADEQLQLPGLEGRHKRVLNQQQVAPAAEPDKPSYDPNQLQLLVNPTEQLARTHRSTDMSMLHDFGDMAYRGTINQEHADRINAPNEDIRRLAAVKEWEARQPKGTYHGSGMYDIIASGEQIHTPIQSHITHQAGTDLDYQQYEGHHRLVAGAAVERDTGKQGSIWMPIQYNERRPPPPRPAHTRGGRRQNAILGMGDSDVRAGVRAVHDAEYTSQVGRTDQYRFQNDAMDAQGWIKARNRLNPHGDATNRAAAIKAAVLMGQNQATWPKKGMGVGTAVALAGSLGPSTYTKANNIKTDSALERLLNEEESIERKLHGSARHHPGPETASRVNELLGVLGRTDQSDLSWARRNRPKRTGDPAGPTTNRLMDKAVAVHQAERGPRMVPPSEVRRRIAAADVPNTAARNAAQQMPRVWSPPKRGQRIRLTTM